MSLGTYCWTSSLKAPPSMWRLGVSRSAIQLAMTCLVYHSMLCCALLSSSFATARCARRASHSAACLMMAAAPANTGSIPQGNMQIAQAPAAGTPECQAGMCSTDVQVSRGLQSVAAAWQAVLCLSVSPVARSALFRCQEFNGHSLGSWNKSPPPHALPAVGAAGQHFSAAHHHSFPGGCGRV